MEKLIHSYEAKVVEAGCAPGAGRYGLQLDIVEDISPVFPYLNATLPETVYDHQNHILIWREKEYAFALRAHRIDIAQFGGIDEPAALSGVPAQIVARINRVWSPRAQITPCYQEKARATTVAIYQLLPKTNCKKCGYITCLAYAAGLREGKTKLVNCPPLSLPDYAGARQKLMTLLTGKL